MENTNTLESVEQTCWQLLSRAANYKKDPMRTFSIGTVSKGLAQMRTVVLRKIDAQYKEIYCYTDLRSAKVDQIYQQPTISCLFYHPKKQIQIRAMGVATIHHQTPLTEKIWKNLPYYARKTYGTEKAPATPLSEKSDNLPPIWQQENIELAATDYAYENFAVLSCQVTRLDWLHLSRTGHSRAQFEYLSSDWTGKWVVP